MTKRNKGLIFIVIGVLVVVIEGIIGIESLWIDLLLGGIGVVLYLIGCIYYALGKGYHWGVGVVLAFLAVVGLIILFVLPEKTVPLEKKVAE